MAHLADRNLEWRGRLRRAWRSEAGFTLLEMFLIAVIVAGVMVMAIFGLGSSITAARSRGAIAQIKEQISRAREMAISQQRDIRIEFNAPNNIKLVRIERPTSSGLTTTLADIYLEGNMTFTKYAGLPETPDPWGGAGAVAFGGATTIRFRAGDGALVNQDNEYASGRVFVGLGTRANSAGMVSIFGPTGRVRSYRAMGGTWEY